MLSSKYSFVFIAIAVLFFNINSIAKSSTPKQDSFETISQKLIENRQRRLKGRGIDADYEKKILKEPFIKCLNSKDPLQKDSLISKMLKDRRFNSICMHMMTDYARDEHNPLKKRQYIFNVILRNLKHNNWSTDVVKGRIVLYCFNDKKYYNKESQEIIMDYFLSEHKKDKEGCDLLLIELAGVFDNPGIQKYLRKESAKSSADNFKRVPGYALQLLGRHGDKQAISKIIKISKELVYKRNKYVVPGLYLMNIPQPEIVELLKEFLNSNLSMFNGRDCVPQYSDLSHSAARALTRMIIGFPTVKGYEYPDKKRKECIDWINKNKKYKFSKEIYFGFH